MDELTQPLETIAAPAAMVSRFAAIPDAPPPEILARYATAMVERCRAVLSFRIAERSTGELDPEVAYQAVTETSATLDSLRREHRFPLDTVADRLGLDTFDRDALAFVVAPHLDDTLREDLRRYRQNPGRAHVDPSLLVEILCATRHDAVREARRFDPDWGLAAAGLIEYSPVTWSHRAALLEQELVPTGHLLGLLRGFIGLDLEVARFARLRRADGDAIVGTAAPVAIERWREGFAALSPLPAPLVLVTGDVGVGEAIGVAAARQWERETAVVLPLPTWLEAPALAEVLRQTVRDAAFLGSVLVILDDGIACAAAPVAGMVHRAVARAGIATVIAMRATPHELLDRVATLRVAAEPGGAVPEDAWRASLARAGLVATDGVLRSLGARAPLRRLQIQDVVATALARGGAIDGRLLLQIAGTLHELRS